MLPRVTTPQCGLGHWSSGSPRNSSVRSVSAVTATILTVYPSRSFRHSVPGPCRLAGTSCLENLSIVALLSIVDSGKRMKPGTPNHEVFASYTDQGHGRLERSTPMRTD